jgi:hypothetical protein
MDTEYTIAATMTGPLWWPIGEPATKDVTFTFRRDDTPRPWQHNADTLAEAVERLMVAEDGDFSGPATIEGVLIITHRTARRETRRVFGLELFPSIADWVAAQ